MSYRDVGGPSERCPGCQAEVASGTRLCPSCGGPIDIGAHAEVELKLKPDLRKARLFLGVITGLGLLELLIEMGLGQHARIGGAIFNVCFFGACFLLSARWPLGASIAAMSLFLFAQAAALGAGSFQALLSGLVIKIILVVLLSAGIRAGYRVRDLRGQWSQHARNLGIAALAGSAVAGFLLGLTR